MKEGCYIFTDEVLKRAEVLRKTRDDTGRVLTWTVIAQRLECEKDSLISAYGRYVRGERKGKWTKRGHIEQRVIESKGRVRVTDLAREFGSSVPAMCKRLLRLGLDPEVRKEMSKEVKVP
jgi:hypothetical protein